MTWHRSIVSALLLTLALVGCGPVTPVAPLSVAIDTPPAAAIDVDPATVVAFRFGVDVGSLPSARFTLTDPAGDPVAGTLSYEPNTATFTPAAPLEEGVTYTARVRAPIRAGGRALVDDVVWSFTTLVRREMVTVTLTDLAYVYDGEPKSATVTAEPDVALSVTYDGEPAAPTQAGVYEVVATVTAAGFAGSATGTLTIAPRPLTLTGLAADDKVYDGSTDVVVTGTPTLAGAIAGDDVALGGQPTFAFASANAGAAVPVLVGGVTLTGADAANYALNETGPTAAITARAVTIVASAGQSKTYGEDDPTFGYDADGLVAGDALAGALGRAAGENVGTYAFTIGTLSGGSNYALAFPGGGARFAIEPRVLRIIPDAGQGKEFQEPDPVMTFTSVGLIGEDVATGGLGRAPGEEIGSYAFVLGSVSAGGNYALALAQDAALFEVRPRTVVVTPAANQAKEIGAADPAFAFEHTPLLPGDELTGELGRVAGEAVGSYAFTLGTLAAADHYQLVLAEGAPTFRIAPLVVTITPTIGLGKVFGEADPELTFTASGLEDGDTVTGSLGRTAGEGAGAYAYALGDLDAGPDYALAIAPGADTFTITPRTVEVTPGAGQRKVFGDDDPDAFSFTTSGFLGDDALLDGTLLREAGEDVGAYAFTVDDLDGGANYRFELVAEAATFAITPLPVLITPTPGQSKVVGAPDPLPFTFTLTPEVPEGELEGELSREEGEEVGTFRYVLHTFGGNPNYALSIAPEARFTITPAD